MTSILEVREVDAGYGDVSVLRKVSLIVKDGEIVAVVGANGAGKSTLLLTIAGLVRPTAGEIILAGQSITSAKPYRLAAKGLALVPEGSRLFPFMTVFENLELGAYTSTTADMTKQRMQEVMELFPVLAERRNQLAGNLSGGERQMCGIGRALMSSPKVLLLDEPSVGLSPKMVHRVFEAIQSLATLRKMAIVIVEQNVYEALDIGNRAYVLSYGAIVRSGDARLLRDDREIQETYMGL